MKDFFKNVAYFVFWVTLAGFVCFVKGCMVMFDLM